MTGVKGDPPKPCSESLLFCIYIEYTSVLPQSSPCRIRHGSGGQTDRGLGTLFILPAPRFSISSLGTIIIPGSVSMWIDKGTTYGILGST